MQRIFRWFTLIAGLFPRLIGILPFDLVGLLLVNQSVNSRSKGLVQNLNGVATDRFLDFLLDVMSQTFLVARGYRRHIKGFKGRYIFKTAEDSVVAAIFENEKMRRVEAIDKWDVRVTFKSYTTLRDFVFSEKQDIMDLLLNNGVKTEGNLNYVYKFVFLSEDLKRRLFLKDYYFRDLKSISGTVGLFFRDLPDKLGIS